MKRLTEDNHAVAALPPLTACCLPEFQPQRFLSSTSFASPGFESIRTEVHG